MSHDPFPSLLNEYKYVLTRRRLLQTITGGVRIQTLPVSLHIFQWFLWILPLLVSLPFIASAHLWNVYYLGLIYSITCGGITLILGLVVKTIYWKGNQNMNEEEDDEQQTASVSSFLSLESMHLVFTHKRWIDVIIHTVSSGLTCYSSFIILDPFVMIDVLPIPAVVFVFILGVLTLCTAHYSLIATPPKEISIYRQPHQDRIHLGFLRRPIFIIAIGTLFIVLRNLFGSPFLIIPYVLHSMLPVLWTLGTLPPPEALLFWLLEQVLLHLMGGSIAASETRLLIQFSLALMTTVALALVHNQMLVSLLAAGLGFLLSQNLIHWGHKAALEVISCFRKRQRLMSNLCDNWYTSYFIVDYRAVRTKTQIFVCLCISLIKCGILLALSVVIVSQTFGKGSGSTIGDRTSLGLSVAVICVSVLARAKRMCLGAFTCCGMVRNPFHPRNIESLGLLSQRKKLLLFVSIPIHLLMAYVSPLLMVTYVSLLLDTNSPSNRILFAITTLRLYRKVWQNTSASLTELSVVAVLVLSLPSESSWGSLGIGTQALIIGFVLHILCNLLERLKFFLLLFVSFITNCINNPVFRQCLVLSTLLIPVSLMSVLLSAMLSAPLVPLFTLPILLLSFPRPQGFWPRLTNPNPLSQTYEAAYYKQALPAISRSVSWAFTSGVLNTSDSGATILIRFQDRLSLVRVAERGYGHSLIQVQGLELQETSCHTTEAMSIDNIHESLYSANSLSWRSWVNTHPLYNMQPIDVSIGRVYSDARNSLTGIIDRRDSLKRFSENLYKTLIWVFASHLASSNGSFDTLTYSESGRNSSRLDTDYFSGKISFMGGAPSSVIISPSHVSLRSPKVVPVNCDENRLPSSLPFTKTELSKMLHLFPQEWFEFVMSKSNIHPNTAKALKDLVTSCYILMDVPAYSNICKTSTLQTKPGHIHKGFTGEFPSSSGSHMQDGKNWMMGNKLLKELVLRAYRYAVKLLYDEVVLGEVSDNTELSNTLGEYDTSWYIGSEGTEEWESNILKETNSLFSIGYSENAYTAHVLTLQDETLLLGVLNQSLVKGIWSNLTFELHYLTNDDEERYSIQAQPRLLRNLITQGAEVPFGYQIFSSTLITIPSL